MTDDADRHALVRERVLRDLAIRDKSNSSDTFRGVTEASATALDVDRVGIWRLAPDRSALVCEDLFVRNENRHERGKVLRACDSPVYFDQVLRSHAVLADHALSDTCTNELAPGYLVPQNVMSKMDVPIFQEDNLFGVVSHEHTASPRHWRDDEAAFAGNLADIVSVSLAASQRREVEELWATVIDGIAEFVVVFDEEGRIIQASSGSRGILERWALGSSPSVEDRGQVLELRTLAGQLIPVADWPSVVALRGTDADLVHGLWRRGGDFIGYYRTVMKPIVEEGRVAGVICVGTDVTEDVVFAQFKDECLAELASALHAPISSIKRDVALASRDATDATRRARVDTIGRAAARMERMLEELVEISSLRLGTLPLTSEPIEIGTLITSQIEVVSAIDPDRRIRVNAHPPVTIVGDRHRLEQVIHRLLLNALRYSPDGGDVEVEVSFDAGQVLVSVHDRGIGIPTDKQPQIFEAFFRAHARTAHDYGGLGIGLYLSREIARLHGGELWFVSIEGSGSTFYLRLPRRPDAPMASR